MKSLNKISAPALVATVALSTVLTIICTPVLAMAVWLAAPALFIFGFVRWFNDRDDPRVNHSAPPHNSTADSN